jgi:hypothetical protein
MNLDQEKSQQKASACMIMIVYQNFVTPSLIFCNSSFVYSIYQLLIKIKQYFFIKSFLKICLPNFFVYQVKKSKIS